MKHFHDLLFGYLIEFADKPRNGAPIVQPVK